MRTIQIRFADDVTNPAMVARALLSAIDCGRVVSSSEGIANVEIPGFDDDATLEELWCATCDDDDRVVQWR
jgi:hypothetical protein